MSTHAQCHLEADLAYQSQMLERVSRTFALTIPQLPPRLHPVVANAYLLCRIADTIEDDPQLPIAAKRRHAEQFIHVLEGELAPARFSGELHPLLSTGLPAAERELVLNTPRVVRVTHSFSESQQAPMRRCVRIMSKGMARFQERAAVHGVADMDELDQYCYHVAGVVGEMLTELFCVYSADIARHRQELLRLAVSFGQGLQMTNILKDVWEDQQRGACWLPRDVFGACGFDLRDAAPGTVDPRFLQGFASLLAVARGHLANALDYTLRIPRHEAGIRRFCLWALGMAVLTLRKIHAHPGFSSGNEVKISRRAVKATTLVTNVTVRRDVLLRAMFGGLTRRLPAARGQRRMLSA